jgi:hypothetical protein
LIEILRKPEAQHGTQPDGHVRIAAEIEIDLQRVRDDSDPGDEGRELAGRQPERMVGKNTHAVGDHDLFGEAVAESDRAILHRLDRDRPPDHAILDFDVTHDGTGDELRKAGVVHAEVDQRSGGAYAALEDVDDVGDRLEGEKRDAGRQRRLRDRHERPAARGRRGVIQCLSEKAEIFVEHKRGEIGHDSGDECSGC